MTDLPVSSCVACGRTSNDVPLLTVEFRGAQVRICTQHFPILIHDPGQLAGRLPGAESLEPSDHHD
jgi:hypothetical protein